MTARRRSLITAVMFLVAAVIGVLAAPSALAHAVLVASSPPDGSRLESAPRQVRLDFDEPVQPVADSVIALSETGQRVSTGVVQRSADGRSVVVLMQPDVATGVYSVTWRVISADSHIVSGSIRFGVRHDAVLSQREQPRLVPLDYATSAANGILYLGLVQLVGVPGVVLILWPSLLGRRAQRLAWGGWWLLLVATAADFLLRGPRAMGASWRGVVQFAGLTQTVGSWPGRVLLARLVVLALIALLFQRARLAPCSRRTRLTLLVLGVVLLLSVALLGHAAVGSAAGYVVALTACHLVAMSLWLGGLLVLLVIVLPHFRHSAEPVVTESMRRILRQWSLLAFGCLATVVATGEVQALATVAPVSALWSTRYGYLLLAKMALVGLVMVVAAGAHRLAAGRRTERGYLRTLRRIVLAETAALVAVLAVTSVLTQEPTARETYGPSVAVVTPLGPDQLRVAVDQTRRGPVSITLIALDSQSNRLNLRSVHGVLSTTGVAALSVSFHRNQDGSWSSSEAQTPLPGVWTLTVQVAIDQATGYATAASWPVW